MAPSRSQPAAVARYGIRPRPGGGGTRCHGPAAGRFASASAVLLGLLLWIGAELVTGAGHAGLAERVMGALQALWPLLVVLSCYRTQFSGQAPVTGLLGDLGAAVVDQAAGRMPWPDPTYTDDYD